MRVGWGIPACVGAGFPLKYGVARLLELLQGGAAVQEADRVTVIGHVFKSSMMRCVRLASRQDAPTVRVRTPGIRALGCANSYALHSDSRIAVWMMGCVQLRSSTHVGQCQRHSAFMLNRFVALRRV